MFRGRSLPGDILSAREYYLTGFDSTIGLRRLVWLYGVASYRLCSRTTARLLWRSDGLTSAPVICLAILGPAAAEREPRLSIGARHGDSDISPPLRRIILASPRLTLRLLTAFSFSFPFLCPSLSLLRGLCLATVANVLPVGLIRFLVLKGELSRIPGPGPCCPSHSLTVFPDPALVLPVGAGSLSSCTVTMSQPKVEEQKKMGAAASRQSDNITHALAGAGGGIVSMVLT